MIEDTDASVYQRIKSSRLMAWLGLFRWKNLFIIFLTQWIAYVALIKADKTGGALHVHGDGVFWLITLSTIFIAAAGYVINDYFDVGTDLINRPHKVVLSSRLARRSAILLHITLNAAGIYYGWRAGHAVGQPKLVLLQISCAVALWFYSTHLKRRFLWGNITVSLLAALTILMLPLYLPELDEYTDSPVFMPVRQQSSELYPNPFYVLMAYGAFAFFINWMREIVKDMEDLKGDISDSCETMPVRWGLLRTARFVQALGVIISAMLTLCAIALLFYWYITAGVLLLLMMIAMIRWMYKLPLKADVNHYMAMSFALKWMMIIGLCALAILAMSIRFTTTTSFNILGSWTH